MDKPVRDIWQQGGRPMLNVMTFVTLRARDRALDLDSRTVYRKRGSGAMEEVAVFRNAQDAQAVVIEHNRVEQERGFERLHERIGNLIERLDSSTMGDPVV